MSILSLKKTMLANKRREEWRKRVKEKIIKELEFFYYIFCLFEEGGRRADCSLNISNSFSNGVKSEEKKRKRNLNAKKMAEDFLSTGFAEICFGILYLGVQQKNTKNVRYLYNFRLVLKLCELEEGKDIFKELRKFSENHHFRLIAISNGSVEIILCADCDYRIDCFRSRRCVLAEK